MTLFEENSAKDLVCRGFQREHVLAVTSEDVGGKAAKMRVVLKGLDRFAYKVEHVQTRMQSQIAVALSGYGAGALDRAGVWETLGLAPGMPVSLCSMKDLFAALDKTAEFAAAKKLNSVAISEKAAATNMARYGGKSPMASAAVRDKVKATTLENYGVTNPSQSDVIKERKIAISQRNFGVDHPLQAASVQAELRETTLARHGVENVSQLDAVKQKKRDASQARYGVDTPLLDPGVRAQQLATLRARYPDLPVDAQGPFASASVRERAEETMLARRGVRNPFELSETQEQVRRTMFERYGADNASLVAEIQGRRRQTFVARYGVENPFQDAEIMKDNAKKVMAARKRNKTLNTSAPEQDLHKMLLDFFGVDDVVTQYSADPRYPFHADFYIPSRDMFIELNGSWTHGPHWFDANSAQDQFQVLAWTEKSTPFYLSAIKTWTISDVAKRQAAEQAGLNYVTLWDGNRLLDVKLWLALGAPNGTDWEREYSWLPERAVSAGDVFPELSAAPRTAIKIARAANGAVFRERELALWEEDGVHKTRYGRLRARLFANRLAYTGKLPDQLSDNEILRGLGIAGELHSMTVFDNTGMRQVLEEHSINSVYDPCAGWGERMATCAALDVEYVGTDINAAVVAGHAAIAKRYSLSKQHTWVGDAALVNQRSGNHDAVFTCPPYGDVEVYTEHGAENLSDADFINWWAQVVSMSVAVSTRVFAYQINVTWKERMNEVLLAAGWTLADEIVVGKQLASHFNRKADGSSVKREYESIQVFTR